MKNILLSTALIACVSTLAACGGGSGGTAAVTTSSSSGGSSGGTTTTRVDSITICGTTTVSTNCPSSAPSSDSDSSGFWNPVDILYTSAATRAVIFLHGGGGTNFGMENDLGLNDNDAPPNSSDINFGWLTDNQIIAVFPQGQGLIVGGTWNNWVMDSGQDDVAMLQALATYVKSTYGVGSVYLVGHSNGGMMANRMWCESPGTFDGYVALAGPPSTHYQTTACAPSTKKPYYGIIGAQDTVLCDNSSATTDAGGSTNPLSSCDTSTFQASATWTINPNYINGSSAFINPNLINEYQQQASRAKLMCGETTLTLDAADSNSLNTVWSNCSGTIMLQEVLNANHPLSYSHGLCSAGEGDNCSLEVASGNGAPGGTGLLGLIANFLNSIPN